MLDVLQDRYFHEYYGRGFVETGMSLPLALVDEIRLHYTEAATRRNDFPKFFTGNEHQAYLEGKVVGTLMTSVPKLAGRMVERLYDRTYRAAVYADQTFLARVLQALLEQGLGRFFRTRYMVAGYDIVLANDRGRPGAGIHTDFPTFHHFYETDNDVTLYIPLVDLNDDSGGRITVLPESKLKVSGNMLLKELQQYFGADPRWLDDDGYIDPERITPADQATFVRSQPYRQIMEYYRNVIGLANKCYADEFEHCDEPRGKVLLWSNKNFHAAEPWRNPDVDRAVYIVRLFPIYDTKIKLKSKLHGKPFNNHLVDMRSGELTVQEGPIDLSRIPVEHKLPL